MSLRDKVNSKLGGIVNSLKHYISRAIAFVSKFFKKAALSVEHLEAIKEHLELIAEHYPELRDRVENIVDHLEKLMEIWGIK